MPNAYILDHYESHIISYAQSFAKKFYFKVPVWCIELTNNFNKILWKEDEESHILQKVHLLHEKKTPLGTFESSKNKIIIIVLNNIGAISVCNLSCLIHTRFRGVKIRQYLYLTFVFSIKQGNAVIIGEKIPFNWSRLLNSFSQTKLQLCSCHLLVSVDWKSFLNRHYCKS